MNATDSPRPDATTDPFGTRDVLQVALQKLSSQILVFALAVIVILIAGWAVFGPSGLPVVVAALVVFALAAAGYLFAETRQKMAASDPETMNACLGRKVDDIANQAARFGVMVWTAPAEPAAAAAADGARDIAVVPGEPPGPGGPATYRVGDAIKVGFRADHDCYLTLLNIGTSGKLTVLFPNAMHPDSRVTAGEVQEIPGPGAGFEYRLQGPPGTEHLKAIATLEPVDLGAAHFTADGELFRTVPAREGARDIAVIRTRMAELADETWTDARTSFEVAP